ncbi:MAG: ribosome biogenesis GTP-binding protein YihA/YsxC [Cytophagales bacterium]
MIKEAKFVLSCDNYLKAPQPTIPEYAFIGRSNVGKSSLINMLTNHKKLAKTSSTPGKTQCLNYFIINEKWYLVDVPGYGFAKVSQTLREKFDAMVWSYMSHRENLCCVFILVDIRIEPQKSDLEMILNCGENGIPFAIIFTKADKLKNGEIAKNVTIYKNVLKQKFSELPMIFITSSESGRGKEEILEFINGINESELN